ncbi:polynucleotide kinase-phosphatase [Mesobacillus jeotgali]|uniref:polynucleotide kinase-phosphatase n=1 Tax=Mesobacillus jeotgali TaxID=129985 RepID=UPI0009A695EC|nr:polynucleotide kinase-phosphatase [Mesobacillus jeotgali]
MRIALPHTGIVLLVGPSNSGKTTLLKRWQEQGKIAPSEVVSSDQFRELVSDKEFVDWRNIPKEEADILFDEYSIISKEAFEMMDSLIRTRCRLNKLTLVDATHLQPDDRKRYIAMARESHVPIVSIVLDVPEKVLLERDEQRANPRSKRRIKQQYQVFTREKRFMKKEGIRSIYFVKEVDEIELTRRSHPLELEVGAGIDIIGDIHGCYDEMIELLEKLGYKKDNEDLYLHPEGRRFLSIGDVMSRGPQSLRSMIFFYRHVEKGLAYMIDSNHGWKIARWLDGKKVTLSHGDEKVEQEFWQYEEEYGAEAASEWRFMLKDFLLKSPSHYILKKNGIPTVVCAHAGIKDEYIGKQSPEVSDFCRYGDTDGFNEKGKPVRKDWFIGHQTSQLIVWGHDPKPQPLKINNSLNIDQGAVFGGNLTAFRYPEKQIVSVKAREDYSGADDNPLHEWERKRLNQPNIGKFLQGYSVLTDEFGEIAVPAETVKPAIDTVSHYTIPIEQLLYIPPTMSPTPAPSPLEQYLEHPAEAIRYYRSNGIEKMVAEKKHMGSRGILLLFKDHEAAKKHVGAETLGVIYTRTGRRFFEKELEEEIIHKLNDDLHSHEYFARHQTDYVLLDAEIMPWNLKAKELISKQYAHVAENAIMDRSVMYEKLAEAAKDKEDFMRWLKEYDEKLTNAKEFAEVFQGYCWDVVTLDDIQIAPFHVLAHSDMTFFNETHEWHMKMNHQFAHCSSLFVTTEYKIIDSPASEAEVIEWWEKITKDGHEGIVIKPERYIARSKGQLLQPAIKVRGSKYLKIIYGMDYLQPENLIRLKKRNTGKKQKLALKEFALGIEGIHRFVNKESIERVHECVLATLAMEQDRVDPRL